MFKILILLLIFLDGCVIAPGARFNGKVIRTGDRNIFGTQHYKYRCEKPGKCCEVGKDCEEDLKQKEDLKNNE